MLCEVRDLRWVNRRGLRCVESAMSVGRGPWVANEHGNGGRTSRMGRNDREGWSTRSQRQRMWLFNRRAVGPAAGATAGIDQATPKEHPTDIVSTAVG